MELQKIPLNKIQGLSERVRKSMSPELLEELEASLREVGQLVPVKVRADDGVHAGGSRQEVGTCSKLGRRLSQHAGPRIGKYIARYNRVRGSGGQGRDRRRPQAGRAGSSEGRQGQALRPRHPQGGA